MIAVSGARWSTKSLAPPSNGRLVSVGLARVPLVPDDDLEAGDEVRRLAGPGDQLVVLEARRLGEDLAVGPVSRAGARDAARDLPDHVEPGLVGERLEGGVRGGARGRVAEDARLAPPEGHVVGGAVAIHPHVEPLAEGVDDGRPDAVESTRRRVRAAAELAAGVELGHDDLDARSARSSARCPRGCRGPRSRTSTDSSRVQHDLDPLPVAARAPRRPSCRGSPTGSA